MKRLFALMLTIALIGALVACATPASHPVRAAAAAAQQSGPVQEDASRHADGQQPLIRSLAADGSSYTLESVQDLAQCFAEFEKRANAVAEANTASRGTASASQFVAGPAAQALQAALSAGQSLLPDAAPLQDAETAQAVPAAALTAAPALTEQQAQAA